MCGDERGIRELRRLGELYSGSFCDAKCALCDSEMYPFEQMYLYSHGDEICGWVCGDCLKDKVRELDASALAWIMGIDECSAGDIR